MIRLLHIVGDSRFGGAGRIILGLSQMAKAQGWDVDILTTDPTFQQAAKTQGLRALNLDVIRRPIRPLWDLNGLIRLRNFLKCESYEIVHTHTSKGGFVGRLAAAMAKVPVIVHTMHGLAFHERSGALTRTFYSTLERIAAARCDRIVSVSKFHGQWAVELGICKNSKIVPIQNGIAPTSTPFIDPLNLRRRLGLSAKDIVLLTTARLAPDKGLEYLIQAAAMVRINAPHCKILIAGDGPVRKRLEGLVCDLDLSDHVIFLGFRQDVDDLLAASDAVILPSLREGLSISLLEAMAAGKPIIASSIGSHLEVAADANIAKLVAPADARALSDAILDLIGDPGMMMELGTNARRLFEQHYHERRMLAAYHELYLDLLRLNCTSKVA
jgi:glycosyltransferase involved in cell wall biosynthesis